MKITIEINDIIENGITLEEMELGKQQLVSSYLLGLDDSSSFSSIKAAVINEAVAKGEVKRVGAMGKRTEIKKVLNSSHKKYKLRNDPARANTSYKNMENS